MVASLKGAGPAVSPLTKLVVRRHIQGGQPGGMRPWWRDGVCAAGTTEYRLEPLYSDPVDGCVGGLISADGKSVTLSSIAAHGFCAFKLRRD